MIQIDSYNYNVPFMCHNFRLFSGEVVIPTI